MTRRRLASNLGYQLQRIFVGAMLALAFLSLLGKAAHAQTVCGDIADQPEAVYENLAAALEPTLPIEDAGTCEKIVKTGVSACHEAVSDAASCQGGLVKSVLKALKSGCATSADPDACNDFAREQADATEAGIESSSGDAHGECDAFLAPQLLGTCLGIP